MDNVQFFFIIIQLGLKQNLQIGSIRHGNPSMLCLVITQISVQFALKCRQKVEDAAICLSKECIKASENDNGSYVNVGMNEINKEE